MSNQLLERRRVLMTNQVPYDAQIQYLETDSSVLPSTGNGGTVQYILTGCYPTPRTRIKVRFRFADNSSGNANNAYNAVPDSNYQM